MNQTFKRTAVTTIVCIVSLLIASSAFTAALEANGIVFRVVAGFIALIAAFFFPLYVILRKPQPAGRTETRGAALSSRSLSRTNETSRSSSSSSMDGGLIYAGAASAGYCSSSASTSSCSGSSDGGGGGGD